MKTGLVLGGGGSRGAYQLGVWTALLELGEDYDLVCGTSIGAINGALFAQKSYGLAKELWNTITVADVMADGINFDLSAQAMLDQAKQIKPFLEKYVNHKGADISPLIALLKKSVSEKEVRQSPVDFGVVTMAFPSLRPMEVTKSQMPKGSLHDYLLASAACFPAFPMYKIGGKSYVDGGYYDNLPIDLAIKMGAQRVIAADLGDKPAHPKYQNEPNVVYIFPSQPLGSILNFAQDVMQKNQQMGYFDTLRAFGRVRGFTYSFCPEGVDGEAAAAFWQRVRRFEAKIPIETRRGFTSQDDGMLTNALREHTFGKMLDAGDYFLRGAEICAQAAGITPDRLYSVSELNGLLKEAFSSPGSLEEIKTLKDLSAPDISAVGKALQGNSRRVIGRLYQQLCQDGDAFGPARWLSGAYAAELCGALYLYTVFGG